MASSGEPEAPRMASTESQADVTVRRAWSAPEAVLVVAHTGSTLDGRQRHSVTADDLVVGREPPANGLRVEDRRMSRLHFSVRMTAVTFWEIRDLDSRNGTMVNGRPITGPIRLELGDVVRAGDTLFVLAAASPLSAWEGAHGLVGLSAALQRVRDSIERGGASTASVLIQGETGVGKELVARAIHECSGRTGAFVAFNCAAVAESLLESELFGHVRGAFTGATADRPGLLRAADGGTVFLDEVGEMPARLQVQLLRTLETRTVRPVGAWKELAVDVRVVAATHRDLVEEVQGRRLRSDLYARLAQWLIEVPPLRERRDDVPLLVRALLERHGAADRPVDVGLVEALLLARWALNVRGLANAVASAVIAGTPGEALHLGPMVAELIESAERLVLQQAPSRPAVPGGVTTTPTAVREAVECRTRDELCAALEAAHGNIAAAARSLGCSRPQLYRLFQLHGLDVDRYRRRPL